MKIKRCLIVVFLTILLGLNFTNKVKASGLFREEILSFHSRIEVLKDASMIVTETIRVRALGYEIKRGIYRDFPTLYKDALGFRQTTGFQVISIKKKTGWQKTGCLRG